MTLRAVGQASGVSHNAPYKHFESRDALLAAVATADFAWLRSVIRDVRASAASPARKLMTALQALIEFSAQHSARYGLMFGNPKIIAAKGEVQREAFGAFLDFAELVKDCQTAGSLPDSPENRLPSLLFATMHGLIAIDAAGGMHPEKGLTGVESSLRAWLALIAPQGADSEWSSPAGR